MLPSITIYTVSFIIIFHDSNTINVCQALNLCYVLRYNTYSPRLARYFFTNIRNKLPISEMYPFIIFLMNGCGVALIEILY